MPLYGLTSSKNLTPATKQELVDLFTEAHCRIMIAPEQFVHVVFLRNPADEKQTPLCACQCAIGEDARANR